MRDTLCRMMMRFVREEPGNRFPEEGSPYFAEPLIGFAAADDPLFAQYKTVIGPFHLTPAELALEESPPWRPATVICWALPISEETRRSNRSETTYPSRAWALTREHGEAFNAALRRQVVQLLVDAGYRALAPQLHPAWREYRDSPVGIASSWSERHAAYAAGLGTFSLNDALITPAGIAHRLGSVITDAHLEPTARTSTDHRSNCLWYREGSCGACIGRCPVGALSRDGHDKRLCREHVYATVPGAVGEKFGVTSTGCGLCQTKVPCEDRVPAGKFSPLAVRQPGAGGE
ncbi:epoxyqueuosine reductase [Geomonas sp. Red69]|uniref:epoxyqueuosine reductase n=1 Tax=Geomonas diazotrophica TaxID=2843197 RepID=UPI001C125C71|nr:MULTISPECIES: epoxyqueuosine reductase [Geomonas]MBU5635263.1 epoxyqueuosine reductase [Geomonas diazotrophica]QXE86820.1 epoxyqueuosine reductase [Geomonas nitrogeniifigens]